MATVTIATRTRKTGKSYVVQYQDPATGKKTYYKSYRRKDKAREAVNRLRTLLDSGSLPEKDGKKSKQHERPTFGRAVELAKTEWDRKHGEGAISDATHAGYNSLINPVERIWRDRLLTDITEEQIRDYRISIVEKKKAALKKKKKDTKNYNVLANRRLFVIKQAFSAAKKAGLIDRDVAANISYLNEKGSERKVAQTPDEIEALIVAAYQRKTRHYLPLAILLAVEHGCSTQEVLSLKWGNICLKENRITFHRQKNGVTRTHQIMPRTRTALIARLAHLEKYRQKHGVKVVGEHIIGRMDGSPFKSIRGAWRGLCKDHSFEDLHYHDHRHSYCTNLLLSGSTLMQTSVLIGHQDLRMTKRYSNLEGVMDSQPLERLAKRYAKTSNDQ